MATKTLVIDGTDPKHFALMVEADILRVGDTPAHTEGILKHLRIVRIRCEVEVEEDRDSLTVDEPGVIAPQTLRSDAAVKLGHAHLSLLAGHSPMPTPVTEPPAVASEAPLPTPTAAGPKRLKVIDGGDQGRAFRLPASGTLTVGKTGGHADIGLQDLYVTRVHCSLTIENGVITVTHVEGQNGTLIDGQKISRPQVLKPGCVLRVGNSHLRLEVGPFADESGAVRPVVPKGDGSGVLRALPKPPPPKPTDPMSQLEGHALGPYQVATILGRGFTGAVFQATNAKTGQAVALKVFAAEFPASPAELEHFAQEFKAVQQVRHPNLVTMLGAGRSGAHCWIARELVAGESAADVIGRIAEGEKPSWTRGARVAIHLARVLECLHEHRLVHGNITPRNVLLREGDRAAKLSDLRVAQALEGSQLQRAVLEKKLLAELPYLAPEQAEPGAFVDDLADLYAIGAVAYALVTGRPPATGKTPADILDQIREGRVVKPSSVYKKVPAEFDRVVMKLLARHQEDRYPTAGALLADLEPIAAAHDIKL